MSGSQLLLRASAIQHIVAAARERSVTVADVQASFRVPMCEFLDHLPTDALVRLSATVESLVVRLAIKLGRADTVALARFGSSEFLEIVGDVEEALTEWLVANPDHASFGFLFRQISDGARKRPGIRAGGDVGLAKAKGKSRQGLQGGDKLVVENGPRIGRLSAFGHSKSSRSAKSRPPKPKPRKGK